MWFERRSGKADSFSANLAETKHDLKTSLTLSKALASKMILQGFRRGIAITRQNADANRARFITQHMKRLSFASKPSSSFSMNLALDQMDARLIASIRLVIMNQATCAGRQ